jgi:sarcosine oxidase delta subunit
MLNPRGELGERFQAQLGCADLFELGRPQLALDFSL